MPRTMLTDEHWKKLKPILHDCGIYNKHSLRLTFEGTLHRLRTGEPWRDIPEYFGSWNSIYKRFNEWSKTGKLYLAFKILSKDPDFEWVFIDGSVVKAHQYSSGAQVRSMEVEHAIGKSVAGNSSKLHLAVDANGNPVEFEVTGGQVHDAKVAPDLLDKLPYCEHTIADKGYDSRAIRDKIRSRNSHQVIPKKRNSKTGNDDLDWGLYKYRHLVENAFARLKHFRAIATRYDKLKRNYEGMLYLACAFIWLPL